jgi:hypothetical protein
MLPRPRGPLPAGCRTSPLRQRTTSRHLSTSRNVEGSRRGRPIRSPVSGRPTRDETILPAVANDRPAPERRDGRCPTLPLHDEEQSPATEFTTRPPRTTREPAVRTRADDRNPGESGRKPAPGPNDLLIVVSVAERTLPHGSSIRACAPVRGRRAAGARRHAIGPLNIGVPPEAPWSSSTSSRRPVEPGATTSSACRLHGLLRESPGQPGEPRRVRPARERVPGLLPWRAALAEFHCDLGRTESARDAVEHIATAGFTTIPRDGL